MTPSLAPRTAPNLLIVDGFYANPDEVRQLALAQEYVRNANLYKVSRSRERFLFPGLRERFEQLLGCPIVAWEEYGFNGCFQLSLAGDPIVYHSDFQTHAAVIYLSPDPPVQSGTVLLRSRAARGRTPEESARLLQLTPEEAQTLMYHGKLLDSTAWEVVDVIGNWYNRLAIWNARLVHAGAHYFGTDVTNGRLVQMFFFDVAT